MHTLGVLLSRGPPALPALPTPGWWIWQLALRSFQCLDAEVGGGAEGFALHLQFFRLPEEL